METMSCVNSNEQHHTIIAFFKHIGVVQVDGRTVVLIFNGVPIDRTISIHVRQGGKRKEGDEKAQWRHGVFIECRRGRLKFSFEFYRNGAMV
jgi:hypothetical protein